jgi:hypothetical protein
MAAQIALSGVVLAWLLPICEIVQRLFQRPTGRLKALWGYINLMISEPRRYCSFVGTLCSISD